MNEFALKQSYFLLENGLNMFNDWSGIIENNKRVEIEEHLNEALILFYGEIKELLIDEV